MASAESSEKAVAEPVDGAASGEIGYLSDNDGNPVGGDTDDDKKGKTKLQKVTNQEAKLQKIKNQKMFKSASKAVSSSRAFRLMLTIVAVGVVADDKSRYLMANLYGS